MQGIFLITLIILASAFSLPSHKDAPLQDFKQQMRNKPEEFVRTQRNLVQFHNMITCTTSRSSSYYIDYGCYCGYGGAGNPVDATDSFFRRKDCPSEACLVGNWHSVCAIYQRLSFQADKSAYILKAVSRCCKVHDECYNLIMNDPDLCTFPSSVYWKIYTRDDTCTGCADEEGTCDRAICECDGAAARCFAETEWNEEHYNWPAEQCSA